MTNDCLFCKIVEKKIPTELAHENARVIAFHDINPQAPTHILIIPKKHISRISETGPADREILSELLWVAKEIAHKKGLEDPGYRLVVNCNEGGGQTVFHIHVHLLGGRRMTWPPG